MHIHNPTKETMTPMHASRVFPIEPGGTIQIEDKASANHVLNEYGIRGLVALDYGDDTNRAPNSNKTIKEVKVAAGLIANEQFRRNMVINHNQMNESNKHTRKPYIHPTDQLINYAGDLGIKLIKPYEVDDIQQQEMNRIKQESSDMKDLVLKQTETIDKLLAVVEANNLPKPGTKTTEDEEADAKAADTKAKIEKIRGYNRKDYFEKFLTANKDKMSLWPEELKTEARKKYTALIGGELKI